MDCFVLSTSAPITNGRFSMASKKKLLTLNISKLKALTDAESKSVEGGSGVTTSTCATTFCPKSG